jgi:hypothetical protein
MPHPSVRCWNERVCDMRLALTSVLAAVLMTAGAASAQTPGTPTAITRAYTVEPFAPSAPITIQGQGVRLRAEPFTTRETQVLSSGSTGLELTVVGLTRMPDWAWYQVVLRNGQKAFIRSDLTSAPMAGGGTQVAVAPPQVATQPVAQPRPYLPPQPGAITMTPQPNPAAPVQTQPQPRPATGIDLPLPSSSSSAPLQSTPAPSANSGLISVAPMAPVPRMTPTGSLSDHVMATLVDKRCWTDSSSMMDAQRLKAIFALTFGTDSKLAAEPVLIQPALSPTDDPAMMVFIAKARAALRTCNGMGFDIPPDYFQNGARPEVRVEFKAR